MKTIFRNLKVTLVLCLKFYFIHNLKMKTWRIKRKTFIFRIRNSINKLRVFLQLSIQYLPSKLYNFHLADENQTGSSSYRFRCLRHVNRLSGLWIQIRSRSISSRLPREWDWRDVNWMRQRHMTHTENWTWSSSSMWPSKSKLRPLYVQVSSLSKSIHWI
jgi:hypothetical protein